MDVKSVIAASLLALSGCATVGNFVEQHPVITAAGVAVVAGSIAIAANHHGHHDAAPLLTRQAHESPCSPQGLTSC